MAASELRRSDKEMERAGVEELLESLAVGRAGVISRGEPYVVPMNFAHQGNRVIAHGADEGRLISAIRDGSPVCFEVDEHTGTFLDPVLCEYDTGYVSAIGFGGRPPRVGLTTPRGFGKLPVAPSLDTFVEITPGSPSNRAETPKLELVRHANANNRGVARNL